MRKGGKRIVISLETARKLKEAGLRWEPRAGDCFFDLSWTPTYEVIKHVRRYEPEYKLIYSWEYFEDYLSGKRAFRLDKTSLNDTIFAPRLEQLLAEIVKRIPEGTEVGLEYWNCMWQGIEMKWQLGMGQDKDSYYYEHEFVADTPEEAAAQALLWILEQEKEE